MAQEEKERQEKEKLIREKQKKRRFVLSTVILLAVYIVLIGTPILYVVNHPSISFEIGNTGIPDAFCYIYVVAIHIITFLLNIKLEKIFIGSWIARIILSTISALMSGCPLIYIYITGNEYGMLITTATSCIVMCVSHIIAEATEIR